MSTTTTSRSCGGHPLKLKPCLYKNNYTREARRNNNNDDITDKIKKTHSDKNKKKVPTDKNKKALSDKKAPSRIRTRITRFKVWGANHYTIRAGERYIYKCK